MKKSKLLFSLMLAAVLCFASLVPALAAGTGGLNTDGALVGSETAPAQAAITKILQMPKGTAFPDPDGFEFKFKVTPISVDGGAGAMPAIANITISLPDADMADEYPAADVESYILESDDIFAGAPWPAAGVYVYTVEEIADTYTPDPDHETITFSQAKYTLTVFVEEGTGHGVDEGEFYVYAIADVVTKKDNGSAGSGKVDPTPGGDDDEYFFSQMGFTNTYIHTNGAEDPDDPDPVTESTLSVSKTVGGNFASKTLYFDYEMTVTVPSLIADDDIPEFYRAYVVEDGVVVTSEDNADAALIDTDDGGDYIMFIPGDTVEFSLKHGQKLVFVDTPVGTGYDVTELQSADYMASANVTYDGDPTAVIIVGALPKDTDAPVLGQFVGEKANSADFLNTRDTVTPTGLDLNDLPFIAMIVLALGALIAFVAVKSRRRKSYN